MLKHILTLLLVGAALLLAGPASAQTCSVTGVKVVDAYKSFPATAEAKKDGQPVSQPARERNVELGDTVAVQVDHGFGLGQFLASEACRQKSWVLFLNGMPIKGLKSYPPRDPAKNIWTFELKVTDESRETWSSLLSWPGFERRPMTVSMGFADQFPLDSDNTPVLSLKIIPERFFAVWGAIFLLMAVIFFWSARRSNILRDGDPDPDAPASARGTYSLSKMQGAWWFFVILAAYLLIGIVIGDYSNSINSTAIILLGIGAGTVLGSAAIDASKITPEQRQSQEAAAKEAKEIYEQLDAAIATATAAGGPRPAWVAVQEAESAWQKSKWRKLTGQSEDLLTDILSDANGVNFHRFQMAVWTVVLSLVFIFGVLTTLTMPVFNTTLMALLGLSAGTYLGLKIPEATIPGK